MRARNKTALRWVAVALVGGMSVPAFAVDFSGYFRAGAGGTTVSGQSRQCYGLSGAGLKYRLGNECDFYGEFGLSQALKAEGVEYRANLMAALYNPGTDTGSASASFNQMYVDGKGFDFAPTVNFWAGKRFYGRADVHINDTKYVVMDGVGAGADGISLGGAKLNVAYFGTDGAAQTNSGARFNFDVQAIEVNPGGKLRASVALVKPRQAGTAVKGANGAALSLQHDQDNLGGMGLSNRAWLQYAKGSAGLDQNFGNLNAASGVSAWRFVESLGFQAGKLGGQALASYQEDTAAGGAKLTSTSLGGRISYALTNNLKLLAELGQSNRKPDGAASQSLTKLTVGPAIATGPGFWARPELRLYATQASWNAAAAADAANGLPQNGKKSATSYGVQAEMWF